LNTCFTAARHARVPATQSLRRTAVLVARGSPGTPLAGPDRQPPANPVRRRCLTLPALLLVPAGAQAHAFRAGDIEIDHPYALPTVPGQSQGAVYLRRLHNHGRRADRLLAAHTPRAQAVEFHRSQLDAQQVMRMRAEPHIEVPAGAGLRLRHGGEWHLMLLGLQRPLLDGERFGLRLRFEHAGEREVVVGVQRPRGPAAGHPHRH